MVVRWANARCMQVANLILNLANSDPGPAMKLTLTVSRPKHRCCPPRLHLSCRTDVPGSRKDFARPSDTSTSGDLLLSSLNTAADHARTVAGYQLEEPSIGGAPCHA